MKTRVALICLVVLGASLLGVRSGLALTFDGAVRQALACNLDLRAAYFEVDKARGRLLQAGLWPNPALEIAGISDKAFNDESQGVVTVGFNQAFPITGRLRFAKTAARVEVAQAMAEIRNRERLLIGEAERAFALAVANREQIAARRETLGIARSFADLSRQRFQAALSSQVDVNLAELEAQRLEQEIAILESEASLNLSALRTLLGLGPAAPLSVEGSLEAIANELVPPGGEAAFPARRPDLRGLELAGDRARAESQLARAAAWGEPTFGLTYERNQAVDNPTGLKVDQYLGLRVSVPVAFFDRAQGTAREKAAAVRQAHAQAAALELSIRNEIAAAGRRARELGEVSAAYQRQLLPLTAQSTELLRQGYAEGKSDLGLILQSQTQRGALRTAGVDFARERVNALIDLQTAAATSPHLKVELLRSKPSSGHSGK